MSLPVGVALPGWAPPLRPERQSLLGQYVSLEPLEMRHVDSLFHHLQQRPQDMWTYLPYGPFETKESMQDMLEKLIQTNVILFAICKDNEALGWISWLRIEEAQGCIEVGHLCFGSKLQRTREATEAVYLLIDRAFALKYRRVEWKCDSLNAPSVSAASRFGFLAEGLFRQAVVYKGRNRDTKWFSIIDKEWPLLRECYIKWLDTKNFDSQGYQQQCLRELTDIARHRILAMENSSVYCSVLSCHAFPCQQHSRAQFVLTGFGPFAGVESNPTTELMRSLPAYLQRDPSINIKSCTVLETSAVGSLAQLNSLVHESSPQEIFVHFGVDAGSNGFKLEQSAYNEATFRVPDERGFCPHKQRIAECSHTLHTNLDLRELRERLCKNSIGWRSSCLDISTDPGRFVCNWLYFNSLHLSRKRGGPVLFVHVPTFEVCSQDEQLAFVHNLLRELSSALVV